jgi:hypothetical protein
LLFLRVLAWCGFFLVLDGYVPRLAESGVMCAFGVVRVQPELAWAALWSKPLAVGALLSWWAVAASESAAPKPPLARLRFWLALPVALAVALDVGSGCRWLFADKFVGAVTCCSAALDPLRDSAWAAHTGVFGWSSAVALSVFFAAKLALVAGCALAARSGRSSAPGTAAGLALASALVAALGLLAWREVIAPRALGLEFHRCAYEPIIRSPLLGLCALGAALAHLALLSLVGLALIAKREPRAAARTAAWICRVAALLLASELLVVAVHAL